MLRGWSKATARALTAGLVLAVGVACLAGCQTTGTLGSSADPLDLLKLVPGKAWSVNVHGVSTEPVVVDDTVVTYVTTDGSNFLLTGFDVKTGKQLWQNNSSTGNVDVTTPLSVAVTQDKAGNPLVINVTPPVLQSKNVYAHTVTLLDPRSGKTVAESPRLWVATAVGCDASHGACFWAWDDAQQTNVHYRLDAETGTTTREADTIAGYDMTRALGGDVFAVRSGSAENVIGWSDGKVKWSVPTSELLGRPGQLIDSLAGTKVLNDKGVMIVTAEGEPQTQEAARYPADKFTTLALELKTGKVLWRKDKVTPCDMHVLCSGDVVYTKAANSNRYQLETGAATMIGVDTVTGKAKWTSDVKQLGGLGNGSNQAGSLLSPTGVLIYTDSGKTKVLDESTGHTRELEKNELTGCTSQASISAYQWSNPFKSIVTFTGGRTQHACGVSGPVTDAKRFTDAVVSTSDYTWDAVGRPSKTPKGFHAVQTADQLIGYNLKGGE